MGCTTETGATAYIPLVDAKLHPNLKGGTRCRFDFWILKVNSPELVEYRHAEAEHHSCLLFAAQ